MKVMIVVTHLLGTGHLARALTLARSYLAAGDDVRVISGGMPAPLLLRDAHELIQLEPVRSDGVDFTRLLCAGGAPASEALFAKRRSQLLGALQGFAPDILITELFPFGRRVLRDEFIALLKAAKSLSTPPLICASIRDILAPPSKPKKVEFADDTIAAFYDAVLVHSAPEMTPLEVSWPVSDTLRPQLHYTGYVSPLAAGPHPRKLGEGEIIVSAGGGNVGEHVYAAALGVSQKIKRPMRLLIGGADPQKRIAALQELSADSVIVEAARPDFRQMLYHAAASVSLCGYNTALDILQAGTPAVFVPFDEGNEVEQGLRATALAKREGIAQLLRKNLTPDSLYAAIEHVMAAPKRGAPHVFDGAARTVEITHSLRAGK